MADERVVDDLPQTVGQLGKDLEDLRSTLLARMSRRPTGDVELTLRSTPKPGTLLLNGQTVNRVDYPDLWQWAQDQSLVIAGLFTSGNGTTTFGLPDFRGRVPVGVGTLGSDTYALGALGGAARVTLTEAQMPSHSHSGDTSTNGSHGGHFPGSQYLAQAGPDFGLAAWNSGGSGNGNHSHSLNVDDTGGDQAHENRPPYLALNFLIWA
jgi:microcystin-dependent protein